MGLQVWVEEGVIVPLVLTLQLLVLQSLIRLNDVCRSPHSLDNCVRTDNKRTTASSRCATPLSSILQTVDRDTIMTRQWQLKVRRLGLIFSMAFQNGTFKNVLPGPSSAEMEDRHTALRCRGLLMNSHCHSSTLLGQHLPAAGLQPIPHLSVITTHQKFQEDVSVLFCNISTVSENAESSLVSALLYRIAYTIM